MKHWQKFFHLFLVLVMLSGLIGTVAVSKKDPADNLQQALAQIALDSPEQEVRVIVQPANTGDDQRLIEAYGGKYLRELSFIRAFVAKLPAKDAVHLAQSKAVSWVSLDAPVISTGRPNGGGGGPKGGGGTTTVTYTVRDEFNLPVYSNNDGTANWISEWVENDDDGLPVSGNIFVDGNQRLHLDNRDSDGLESAQRTVDLSGAVSAVLTFDYSWRCGDADRFFAVDVSDDGTNFTTLATISVDGSGSMGKTLDLSGVVDFTPNFTVRIRLVNGFRGTTDYLAFDNVQIQYDQQVESGLNQNVYLDTLGVRDVWEMGYTGDGIGVAVIDSGISIDSDFGLRQRKSFNPNSNTVNDVYGHGTHVAGVIGGNGASSGGLYQGIAPDVELISLKISDENGLAYESDTVSAMEWVFDNKDQHNIRVVNLSIQSTVEQSYHDSALAAAAEILWFNGVVVVAATGNWYGGNVYPLNAGPGNDPFIITVGATNEKGTSRLQDDSVPNFSVLGYTPDGFFKPEIFAPGVDIISVLSSDSSWGNEYPDRTVSINNQPQYFRISGTSMATPMVSGAVALLLQAEPNLTPDQVKYRVTNAHEWVTSLPYLSVKKMLTTPTTESANQGIVPHMLLAKMALIAYWSSQNGEENIDWESVDWDAVNWDAVDWDAVNWNAVNWNAVNWNAVNWNAVNWNAVNWNAVNWNAVNWNAVNWNAVNWNAVNWNAVNWNAVSWNN